MPIFCALGLAPPELRAARRFGRAAAAWPACPPPPAERAARVSRRLSAAARAIPVSAPGSGNRMIEGGRPMAGRAQFKWSDLSTGQRTAIGVAAAAELTLKVAALIDIKRRPAGQIRGPKAFWRSAQVVNLLGPVAY